MSLTRPDTTDWLSVARKLRTPELNVFSDCLGKSPVAIGAARNTSTKTKNFDSARGGLDAEEQVSGFRARPQAGCGFSGLQTQHRRVVGASALGSLANRFSTAELPIWR